MIGLLLKDLLILKKQIGIYLALMTFYFIMSLTSKNGNMFGGVIMMFGSLLPITVMAYDERAKWDKYAMTMPVSRNDLVISKYLLALICSSTGFILLLILDLLTPNNLAQNLQISLVMLAIGLTITAVILPILFKFGVEKGRLMMIICIFAPVGAITYLSKNHISVSPELINQLPYLLPTFVLVLLAVSVFLSLNIYAKKEL